MFHIQQCSENKDDDDDEKEAGTPQHSNGTEPTRTNSPVSDIP